MGEIFSPDAITAKEFLKTIYYLIRKVEYFLWDRLKLFQL